jgi:predicted transcriptional regulator of viral defense system
VKFPDLLRLVRDEAVFNSGLLISGEVDSRQIRRQLSRWKDTGKVVQLRRGIYALAEPYRVKAPHPFLIANRLVKASYVSLQSALAWYGMIPEHVPVTTSVTTLRPWSWDTLFGTFTYHHVKPGFFHSYAPIEVSPRSIALVATREKALCDLLHLTPGGDAPAFIRELRLQNLESLDVPALRALARESASPKLERARRIIEGIRG